MSDDEDDIIAGSIVFSANKEEKKKGTKDLSNMGFLQKSNKRMFFEMLNSDPAEDDYQFPLIMQDTMKGRTDTFKQLPGARTDSTATSENT